MGFFENAERKFFWSEADTNRDADFRAVLFIPISAADANAKLRIIFSISRIEMPEKHPALLRR